MVKLFLGGSIAEKVFSDVLFILYNKNYIK
jgi:hypothetical protein